MCDQGQVWFTLAGLKAATFLGKSEVSLPLSQLCLPAHAPCVFSVGLWLNTVSWEVFFLSQPPQMELRIVESLWGWYYYYYYDHVTSEEDKSGGKERPLVIWSSGLAKGLWTRMEGPCVLYFLTCAERCTKDYFYSSGGRAWRGRGLNLGSQKYRVEAFGN